jgi:hypothetical protein
MQAFVLPSLGKHMTRRRQVLAILTTFALPLKYRSKLKWILGGQINTMQLSVRDCDFNGRPLMSILLKHRGTQLATLWLSGVFSNCDATIQKYITGKSPEISFEII